MQQRKLSIELKIKPTNSFAHREKALKDALQMFTVLVDGPTNNVANSRRFERALDALQKLRQIPDFVAALKKWAKEQLERKLGLSTELVLSNPAMQHCWINCKTLLYGYTDL